MHREMTWLLPLRVLHREHILFFLPQGVEHHLRLRYRQLRYHRMIGCITKNNWIDFNCGELVKEKSVEELSQRLYEYVLKVASGEKVKAEEAGFHDMAIFKQGVTL